MIIFDSLMSRKNYLSISSSVTGNYYAFIKNVRTTVFIANYKCVYYLKFMFFITSIEFYLHLQMKIYLKMTSLFMLKCSTTFITNFGTV